MIDNLLRALTLTENRFIETETDADLGLILRLREAIQKEQNRMALLAKESVV